MAVIDIGPGATDRATATGLAGYTRICMDNPANDTGTLVSCELWMTSNGSNVKFGTFYGSGTDYTSRDYETIGTAIRGAETGHLVLATLHTNSAAETVDRIIDVFPAEKQAQIRTQLAATLQAVICQALIPTRDGQGRVCAMEIMIGTTAVGALIRDQKTHQLINVIQMGGDLGMQTRDQSLRSLCERGIITLDSALAHATNPDGLREEMKNTVGMRRGVMQGSRLGGLR